MGTVVAAEIVRQARVSRRARLDRACLDHPALRWHVNGDVLVAHRRRWRAAQTECGLPVASLRVAGSRAPDCARCRWDAA